MNTLMQKLEYIQEQCSDKKSKKKQEDEKNWDDFTRLRKKIAREIKEVRTQLDQRNELLGKTDNNTATVKMSADIRSKIKEIIKDTEHLDTIQKSDLSKLEKRKAKNKKIEEGAEKEIEHRSEIVELCWKHIEECRTLEKRASTFSSGSLADPKAANGKPLITELPDVDGDEGFQLLRKKDQEIDVKLEMASDGVKVLKEMAEEMGKEIQTQSVMLGELEDKVDRTQASLDNINKRLKTTLEKVRKGDRFILDFILLVIVLGLAGFLYNLLA